MQTGTCFWLAFWKKADLGNRRKRRLIRVRRSPAVSASPPVPFSPPHILDVAVLDFVWPRPERKRCPWKWAREGCR